MDGALEEERAVTAADPRLARRLQLSGLLVSLGLLVEAATLFWSHPTAFLVFIGLGGLLVGAGVLLYLFAIVSGPAPRPAETRR
jgi:uncharacterized membrane protein